MDPNSGVVRLEPSWELKKIHVSGTQSLEPRPQHSLDNTWKLVRDNCPPENKIGTSGLREQLVEATCDRVDGSQGGCHDTSRLSAFPHDGTLTHLTSYSDRIYVSLP